jgi:hypothetical protein
MRSTISFLDDIERVLDVKFLPTDGTHWFHIDKGFSLSDGVL